MPSNHNRILPCPFNADCSVRIGVFDDEGNQHGWPGDEYEDDPFSGLQYGIVHDGECGLGYVVFGFQPTLELIVREWNGRCGGMVGKIPSSTALVHASVAEVDGEAASVCEIECVDGVFNVSVSTIVAFEGIGCANECVGSAIEWWKQSDLHRSHELNWWVQKGNDASIHIAEKHGFRRVSDDRFPEFLRYSIAADRG